MNDSIIQKQLAAVTSLTLSLTQFMIAVEGHVTDVAEHVLALTPDKPGVIALLSQIEQTQARLSELKASAETVSRELLSSGLM